MAFTPTYRDLTTLADELLGRVGRRWSEPLPESTTGEHDAFLEYREYFVRCLDGHAIPDDMALPTPHDCEQVAVFTDEDTWRASFRRRARLRNSDQWRSTLGRWRRREDLVDDADQALASGAGHSGPSDPTWGQFISSVEVAALHKTLDDRFDFNLPDGPELLEAMHFAIEQISSGTAPVDDTELRRQLRNSLAEQLPERFGAADSSPANATNRSRAAKRGIREFQRIFKPAALQD